MNIFRKLKQWRKHRQGKVITISGKSLMTCDDEHFTLTLFLPEEYASARERIRELELQVASLHDLIADGVFDEYGSFACWRCVAADKLRSDGVWTKLREERE